MQSLGEAFSYGSYEIQMRLYHHVPTHSNLWSCIWYFCRAKLGWSNESYSDCIAMLNAYQTWKKKKTLGAFARGGQSETSWGYRNFVQSKRINDVS